MCFQCCHTIQPLRESKGSMDHGASTKYFILGISHTLTPRPTRTSRVYEENGRNFLEVLKIDHKRARSIIISKMYFATTARIKTIIETLVEEVRRGGIPTQSLTTIETRLLDEKNRYAMRPDFEIWYAGAYLVYHWRCHCFRSSDRFYSH